MFRQMLSPKLLIAMAAALFLSIAVAAQDGPPPENQPPNDQRPNPLAELGLSAEQIQQLRRKNQEQRPRMNDAQKRLREAIHDLDTAIYADSTNDDLVQTRLKAFQEAQAEVTRLRFTNELNIRKILTPDQLVRFREIRRRLAMAAEKFRQQRQDQQRPMIDGQQRQNPLNQQKRQPTNATPLVRPAVRKGKAVI